MMLASVLGVLAAPIPAPPVVVVRPARWVTATFLAPALRGTDGARAIVAAAKQLMFATAPPSLATCELAREQASALRDRVAAEPGPDQAPVMLALLRLLLDDAPTDDAVSLDRRITAAATAEGVMPDARQTDLAARIVREVLTPAEGA